MLGGIILINKQMLHYCSWLLKCCSQSKFHLYRRRQNTLLMWISRSGSHGNRGFTFILCPLCFSTLSPWFISTVWMHKCCSDFTVGADFSVNNENTKRCFCGKLSHLLFFFMQLSLDWETELVLLGTAWSVLQTSHKKPKGHFASTITDFCAQWISSFEEQMWKRRGGKQP